MRRLIGVLERYRRDAQARALAPIGIECVFEAGYDGFWLQRRLAQAGIACRVMDPSSLKVDRRARRVKTDRVDAKACCGHSKHGAEAIGTRVRSFGCRASMRKMRVGRIASSRA